MVLYLIYECVSMVNRLMIYVYRLNCALWKTGQGSKLVIGESKLENVLVMKIKYNRKQNPNWILEGTDALMILLITMSSPCVEAEGDVFLGTPELKHKQSCHGYIQEVFKFSSGAQGETQFKITPKLESYYRNEEI